MLDTDRRQSPLASRRRRRGLALVTAALTLLAVSAAGLFAVSPASADPEMTYLAVPSGRYPIDVDATPDGTHVFVISRGDGGVADLRVYDTTDFTQVGAVTFGPGTDFNPTSVQVSPDGTQVWVAFYNPGQILVYPAADLEAGGTPAPTVITAGGGFVDLEADTSGTYVYAATLFNPQYQFSTADPSAVPRTINVPNGSRGVSVRTDDTQAYFTSFAAAPAGGVQAVDIAGDGSISLGTLTPTGDLPWDTAYVENVDRVLSSNSSTPTSVSAFTPGSADPVVTDPVDCGPRLLDSTPNGDRVYIACLTGGIVAIDYSTGTPAGSRVDIGANVESVDAYSPTGADADRVYATSGGTDELLVFTKPTITGSGDLTIAEGTPATFTATAADFWQQIRWQSSSDEGTTWADFAGETGESLTVDGTLANSGLLVRLVATSALFDPVIGDPMLLTVTPAPTPPPTTPATPAPCAPGSTTCLPATGIDAAGALGLAGALVAGSLVLFGALAVSRRRTDRA
ncbi:hypothetical protein [Agromyces aureus]|uniref:Gram-positive cocci surface proteins LPxTG domain-containing protein n=1 Tax=Agromyces aureus TaxID=453304 RepID=A0A191WJR9_9MICO|nr:hypothetical protein [Agromyces aureus]ANJ28462.1 hypothetical protein ATC03_18955 [Agromyces aureus]